jgi:hypothetical protein
MKETELMSIDNQKKAVNYALSYINNEIKYLEKIIKLGTHPIIDTYKETIKQKLIVLKEDLKTFEEIYQKIN